MLRRTQRIHFEKNNQNGFYSFKCRWNLYEIV